MNEDKKVNDKHLLQAGLWLNKVNIGQEGTVTAAVALARD